MDSQSTQQFHQHDHATVVQQFAGNPETPRKPYLRIIEQPASKALRFRYECEGRLAGSLPGVNSTAGNKTFPTIQIVGYVGHAIVVVSCVTKDKCPKYRPHPHKLVGAEGCKNGVCSVEINNATMVHSFKNLGIQCVRKNDVENALISREKIRVDPFLTGFSHRTQLASLALNSVRLCFQTFLKNGPRGNLVPLEPVVSEPIYDKKTVMDLVIRKLCGQCGCTATVAGGKEITLLCEKVVKDDISIRFFEEQNDQLVWEAYGSFQPKDVHKQAAITFRTPRYKTLEVDQPVRVFIQLRRPSDGSTSEQLPFEFLPLDSDPIELKRKRIMNNGDPNVYILRHQMQQDESPGEFREPKPSFIPNISYGVPNNIGYANFEPRENTFAGATGYQAAPMWTNREQQWHPPGNLNTNVRREIPNDVSELVEFTSGELAALVL